MLQRAASNAYSWWWASHIRTKQSKWLEQNLADMEEKVQSTLKLIEEEGDSFARRAEMYYKNRPELIIFVQESFRSYRALADRYDHLSTELQKANTTIASVFPEQVQFSMEEENEYKKLKLAEKFLTQAPQQNVPKAPASGPVKELRNMFSNAVKFQKNKQNAKNVTRTPGSTTAKAQKSGLSKEDALAKIDKLQKEILVLQTEKEFLKSSYEHGVKKYNAIDKEINGMQEQVCSLQDEFGDGMFIEDEEARSLMSSAALKSCQEALAKLQDKQKTAQEAKLEHERVKAIRKKLEALMNKSRLEDKQHGEAKKRLQSKEQKVERKAEEHKKELEILRGKIKEHFEAGAGSSLTVTETADKIDELVSEVISLETAVSGQTAHIQRLRSETDGLQAQIQTLEDDDKSSGSKDLTSQLKEMEEKLLEIQDLDQSVQDQNNNLETHFTEARCNLDHLYDKLRKVKPNEELEIASGLSVQVEENKSKKGSKDERKPSESQEKTEGGEAAGVKETNHLKQDRELQISGSSQIDQKPNKSQDPAAMDHSSVNKMESSKPAEVVKDKTDRKDSGVSTGNPPKKTLGRYLADKGDSLNAIADKAHDSIQNKPDENNSVDIKQQEQETELDGEEPNWRLLFLKGMEDREKTLLAEYTTVLRNYKELKKQHVEEEKKSQDGLFETTEHLRELKAANAMKDEEIRSLRQKLKDLQTMFNTIKDARSDTQSPKSLGEVMGEDDDVKFVLDGLSYGVSPIEEKFRGDLDALLEENLDFWLRFSTSFHQIQKFESEFEDLKGDASKLEKAKKNDANNAKKCALKTEARSIYRHLREIQTELTVWLEQSTLLKEELQSRFSSLCRIQEEIAKALKNCAEDGDFKFTRFQAAKFQGELLNMKQENNKVADELQSGLDHVKSVQLRVEQCLTRLNDEFRLAGDNSQLQHCESTNRVPLSSFIFGVKPKKQKQSIFSVVGPALNKKYMK